MMNRQIPLYGSILAIAWIGFTTGLGTISANAAPPEVPASGQAEYEQVVREFLEQREVPVNSPGASTQQYERYKQEIRQFWREVPWHAVYGQWGCALRGLAFGENQEPDGSYSPTVQVFASCGSDAPEMLRVGIRPKSDALNRDRFVEDCGVHGSRVMCVFSDYVGQIGASSYNNSNVNLGTSTIRLGQLALGAGCADGAFKSSNTAPMNAFTTITTYSTTNVNAKWSNRTVSLIHCGII